MVTKPNLVVICEILHYSNVIPRGGGVLFVTRNLNNHINHIVFTNMFAVPVIKTLYDKWTINTKKNSFF